MVYRSVETSTWDDPKVKALPTPGKLLFLYLFTNRHSHVSGLYLLPAVLGQHETGLKPREWDTLCDTLSSVGLCRFDAAREVVWVVNAFRYQGRGEKNDRAAARQLETLHKSPLILEFLQRYPVVKQYVPDRVLHGASEVGSNSLQEQEQEIEKEKEQESPPKPPRRGVRSIPAAIRKEFDEEFWPNVPHRLAKPAALKAFANARLGLGEKHTEPTELRDILAGLPAYHAYEQRRKGNHGYQPLHPSTWLNNERWNDEGGGNGKVTGHPSFGHQPGERWTDEDGRECELKDNGEMWRQLRAGSSHWKKVD